MGSDPKFSKLSLSLFVVKEQDKAVCGKGAVSVQAGSLYQVAVFKARSIEVHNILNIIVKLGGGHPICPFPTLKIMKWAWANYKISIDSLINAENHERLKYPIF